MGYQNNPFDYNSNRYSGQKVGLLNKLFRNSGEKVMVIIKILFVLKVILGLVAYIFIIVNLSKISSAQTTYEVVNGKLMYYRDRNAMNVGGYFALITVIYLLYNVFIYLISLFAIMFAEMAADVHYLRQRR